MDNISNAKDIPLEKGDVFFASIYKSEMEKNFYLVVEKDIDEIFQTTYFTLLSDKGQLLLINSNYNALIKKIKKLND